MNQNKTNVCFVAIIGRPNVGKSSLLNQILSYNLSIVTDTPQTTRDKITGVYTDEDSQIVFVDTPGIHKPLNKLGEQLNESAFDASKENDLVLFLSSADEEIGKGDELILEKIKSLKNKVAVVSKIDKIRKTPELLIQKIEKLKEWGFEQVVSTSVENYDSITSLINLIKTYGKEDNYYFDPDFITDKTMRFLAKEIIRESAILNLHEELPHSIAVEVQEFLEDETHIEINAVIYVKKHSQKGMVIGAGGKMIKKIGQLARKKIAAQFDTPIVLNLNVKEAKKWVDDEKQLKKFGY
ncbi:GTPase Era [Mycoplasma sp. Ms02]|uniref:GTPase Era n=1 Tax=Mycoplasma sp. Ms02 TaxID=353851 RepID=UPI001C894290|nr:GTPase Era [Mycoplasma sp. Ms02]QZE12094.1 GTPase Era [Mycoplasma sp. Ms02]